MGRREEVVELLRKGNPPSKIAQLMGISMQSVMGYLYQKVGEGEISRYEIMLSFDRKTREAVEQALESGRHRDGAEFLNKVPGELEEENCSIDLAGLVIYINSSHAALADMYELIRRIETDLHLRIRNTLVQKYGREHWWRKGVPEKIRAELVVSFERDPEPANQPYSYTTLIHLKEIYDKRWSILCETLPARVRSDKRKFLSNMTRLNGIRNSVMHPVRRIRLNDDDYGFVQSLKDSLEIPV